MDENDSKHVVTIAIPKSRALNSETTCEKRQANRKVDKKSMRLSDATLKKYTLFNPSPLPAKLLKKDAVYRSYVAFSKKQSSLIHKQRLAIGLIEKYKILYIDLRKRLHVDDPEDDVYAVTDYDETFFKYLNGKHLSSQKIPVYKSLKTSISQHLRLRQEIGCRRDCILNIEANRRRENKMYQLTMERYRAQVKSFDIFISEDYQKSMQFLNKCAEFENKVHIEVENFRHLAADKLLLISRLIGLDYHYRLQQKYGRFLFYLSPPSWRSQHREFAHSVEIEAKGFDLGTNSEEDTFNVIFEQMRKECEYGLIKPFLFFTKPQRLIHLFEAFEEQQLNHLSYLNHLGPHAQKMIQGIKQLKKQNEVESAAVVNMITYFQTQLEFAEKQESFLKYKFFKVLHGTFFNVVGDPEVLNIQINLEFVYENVYRDQPNNMTISTIARNIENYYMEYCMKLDEIHSNKVKIATTQYIESEKNILKRAHLATKELRMFSRMEKALYNTFKPMESRKFIPVVSKYVRTANKPNVKVITAKKNSHQLTDTEKEYLSLFTDWDPNEDPGHYIHFEEDILNPAVTETNKGKK